MEGEDTCTLLLLCVWGGGVGGGWGDGAFTFLRNWATRSPTKIPRLAGRLGARKTQNQGSFTRSSYPTHSTMPSLSLHSRSRSPTGVPTRGTLVAKLDGRTALFLIRRKHVRVLKTPEQESCGSASGLFKNLRLVKHLWSNTSPCLLIFASWAPYLYNDA